MQKWMWRKAVHDANLCHGCHRICGNATEAKRWDAFPHHAKDTCTICVPTMSLPTSLLSPTLIQLLHKFMVSTSKALFRMSLVLGVCFEREDGKRIKGEHEKPKGEKTKITLADKSKKELHTAATQSSK
jgi:hypothetical protein